MKKSFTLLSLFTLLLAITSVYPVAAHGERQSATVQNPHTGEAKNTITVPQLALERGRALIPLGVALENGTRVEGFAFIHYKDATHKELFAKSGKPSDPTASCYGFLASGARWKTTESFVTAEPISPALTAQDFEVWDTVVAFDMFGIEDTSTTVNGADTVQPDGKNEVMFGNITDEGAIAVTIVWGIFSGPPQNRKLVEYDVVFDDVEYVWGDATIDPTVMDFENIAIHEFGHAAGLADLYSSSCSEQTMYGYATEGETKKRTLETGDITGIKKLYK